MRNFLDLKLPPVAQFVILSVVIYLTSSFLPICTDYKLIRLSLSVILAMGGFLFAIAGVVKFHSSSTTVDPRYPEKSSVLVCDGVYRRTRNPMYVGMLLLLISMCIFLGSFISLIHCVFFVAYMNTFQITAEEKALFEIFGKSYVAYQKRVRRWL